MHIAIIIGSQRSDSQSQKVGNYIASTIQKKNVDTTVSIIDLSTHELPWFDTDNNPGSSNTVWAGYKNILDITDSVIIVSPEWGGMVPAVLKNFFLRCTGGELLHKPGLIVGVSSGMGGAYPIAELRISSYKNTKICYIPDHIIIRDVNNVLNTVEPIDEADKRICARIDKTLDVLLAYTQAYISIKHIDCIKQDAIPYGM